MEGGKIGRMEEWKDGRMDNPSYFDKAHGAHGPRPLLLDWQIQQIGGCVTFILKLV